MTDQQHPITPPPELVEEWAHMLEQHTDTEVFSQAARWGADTELEACCEWLVVDDWKHVSKNLRAARRPKPTSLKEQALKILEEEPEADYMKELIVFDTAQVEIIRRALEQLDD